MSLRDDDDLAWIEQSEAVRAWRSLGRADRIVLEMFLSLLLLLLVLAFASGGLPSSGQFGDTVGGAANLVTLFVVVLSFRWARGEVTRFRDQQRDVAHADVAREIWRRTYRFGAELIRCCQLARRGPPAAGLAAWRAKSSNNGEEFRDAWADFQLSYGNLGMEHLESLWNAGSVFEFLLVQSAAPTSDALLTIESEAQEAMNAIRILLTPRANLSGPDARSDELRTMIAELSPHRTPPTDGGAAPPPVSPAAGNASSPASSASQAPTVAEVHSTLFIKLRELEHALGDAEERTRALAKPGDLLPKLPNRRLGFWGLTQLLSRREVLSSEQVVLLSQLREIRNAIVHAREVQLTREEFERALDATNQALFFLTTVGR